MGYEKLALFLLYALLCRLTFSSSLPHLCHKDQALALLQFKQMFTINPDGSDSCGTSYSTTVSWNRSRDCCSWKGVNCDETTGRVIELDLGCSQLQGKFHSNSSLFELSNLKRLNLSYNNFSGSHISPKFGEFSSLTHLDLSNSRFSGQIPSEISHLSKLYVLRIQRDYFEEHILESHNFELLLKNLTQLRELQLDSVNISSTFPLNFSSYLTTLRLSNTQLYGTLPERVFHLPNLKSLYLSDNTQLTVGFPKTKWNSSTSLKEVSLSGMNCIGNIPELFSYLTSLDKLYMNSCNLSGSAKPIWNLTGIEFLDLANNQLEGPIPTWNFGNLKSLILRNNSFNGPIPSSVFSLSSLWRLDLSNNHFSGPIPSTVFSLSSLRWLDLSNNHFSGKIEEFKSRKLEYVYLGQNQLEGHIPKSLLNQQNLQTLVLSQNNLSGQIASTSCNLKTLSFLDLGSNNLQGTIPECLGEMNSFVLDLSNNSLSGQIASIICNLKTEVLNLGSNNLEGTIPECLGEMNSTEVLDLSNNNLSGTIRANFSTGNSLYAIKLHGNKLEGKVPRSLINCEELLQLDLGNNELNDIFPKWLGILPNLRILNLRSNKFHGSIRVSRNRNLFPQLQIMDLSSNEFSGNLPAGLFKNFQAMKLIDENKGIQRPKFLPNYMTITCSPKSLTQSSRWMHP